MTRDFIRSTGRDFIMSDARNRNRSFLSLPEITKVVLDTGFGSNMLDINITAAELATRLDSMRTAIVDLPFQAGASFYDWVGGTTAVFNHFDPAIIGDTRSLLNVSSIRGETKMRLAIEKTRMQFEGIPICLVDNQIKALFSETINCHRSRMVAPESEPGQFSLTFSPLVLIYIAPTFTLTDAQWATYKAAPNFFKEIGSGRWFYQLRSGEIFGHGGPTSVPPCCDMSPI